MGTSTQPCFTPCIRLNDSETSPPTLTFAITLVYRASFIVVNFSGHPHFLSSCHSPVLPIISNALLKSTNTTYSGWSCSLHFSCSCRRQYIISTVTSEATLCLRNYFGLCGLGVEEDHGENCACYGNKRAIVATDCSITFLTDGYKTGILPCLGTEPTSQTLVQSTEQIVYSVLPYFSSNSIAPRYFVIFQAGDCSSHLIHGWNLIDA